MSEKAITETNSDTKSDENEVQDTVEVESTDEVEETVESEVEETPDVDTDSDTFKKAVTDEVERIVKARVARERDKSNKLQDEIDELNTKFEASQEEVANAKTEVQKLSSKSTVYEVSYETGLSKEVVESLKGETKEDLLDAAALIKKSTAPSTDGLFTGKTYRDKEKGIAASILEKYNK